MLKKLIRALQRWRWAKDYERSLNERAAVEQELWLVARGAGQLPTRKQCQEWAQRLGVPKGWRG